MANLVLIVDGFKLGTLNSPTYIPSFISSLDSILLEDVYFCENINIDLFYDLVLSGKLESRNNFTLEETFDDFMKRCIRSRENLYFYFKLYKDHYFNYENTQENIPIIKTIIIERFNSFLRDLKLYLT
ncbi:hypothetical protein EXH44_10815 [Actinobacillus indolicus]|uniref:Uncharacterized protein n=2 Tax=Actinobacillus indolicus TaxID=51049 RepID=A0A4P7CKP6_9PAST|nr:hypothetical protein EXH44_10815 [Actinobacillus indolicus]